MVKVKEVKIDGESIYIFNSVIYIFESSTGFTLELDIIVSEIVERKYRGEENLILEIELHDGRVINTIMHQKSLQGGLPQLNLYCELNDMDDYQDFHYVNENDSVFLNVEEGITLEEIRKYEMPNEKVKLTLTLPIDQTEWLSKQNGRDLSGIFKEVIYDYWRKHHIGS